jgi:hypothetical protein
MIVNVWLLMRFYQGALLSWHLSTGVLATAAFGSHSTVKGLILITSACAAFIIWAGWM